MYELVLGVSIGPYALGMSLADVLGMRTDWNREQRNTNMVVLSAGGWHLFFEDDQMTQVGAEPPLEVRGPHGLTLGARLDDIDGDLVWDPDDCVLSLDGEPGLTIDISAEGNEVEDLEVPEDAIIVWLGVHQPPEEAPDWTPAVLV